MAVNLQEVEAKYKAIIKKLKAELTTAKQGLNAQRKALGKKQEHMAADYER